MGSPERGCTSQPASQRDWTADLTGSQAGLGKQGNGRGGVDARGHAKRKTESTDMAYAAWRLSLVVFGSTGSLANPRCLSNLTLSKPVCELFCIHFIYANNHAPATSDREAFWCHGLVWLVHSTASGEVVLVGWHVQNAMSTKYQSWVMFNASRVLGFGRSPLRSSSAQT
jgi:hypothetical protein